MKISIKTRKSFFLIVLMIAISGLLWIYFPLRKPPPIYHTFTVTKGELSLSVLASGKLDALNKVDVGAQVSGQLKMLSVKIGDKVQKGQLLGVIDPEQAENQINVAEATLMELQARQAQARAEERLSEIKLARQHALVNRFAASPQDLDSAIADLEVKKMQVEIINSQIKGNQATLDTAKTNLNYTRIIAPIAGEVTQISTLQGQTVIAAQQAPDILSLSDMSTMLVKAQVSEADVIKLRPGQKAWFTILGDPRTHYSGILKDILPTPEKVNDAVFYDARFEVPNPDGVLRLDMSTVVHIKLDDKKNVLIIPLNILSNPFGDNQYNVNVFSAEKKQIRTITIGAHNDTNAIVTNGLKEGDRVIIGEDIPSGLSQ